MTSAVVSILDKKECFSYTAIVESVEDHARNEWGIVEADLT